MAIDWIENDIAQALLNDAALTALAGSGKVFPVKIPQTVDLPAVVYQRTYSAPDSILNGYMSEQVTVMVNVFAYSYKQAKDIAAAVRVAIGRAGGQFQTDQDLYDDDNEVYNITSEFSFMQRGGVCNVPGNM